MIVKSRAIVLHRFPYSDSSWIVKALTEECGVVSFIIKGGKRKESPFKGAMDPLSLCEVVFKQNPHKAGGGDLQFIKEATLLDWHGGLRSDLMNQAVAQVMAEIILRYAPQGVPLQDEFGLLERAFANLDRGTTVRGTADRGVAPAVTSDGVGGFFPKEEVFARWLLETCDLWGYHLDLDVCSRCERPLKEPAADFHPEAGGLICKACLGVDSPRAKSQTLLGLWKLRGGCCLRLPDGNGAMDENRVRLLDEKRLTGAGGNCPRLPDEKGLTGAGGNCPRLPDEKGLTGAGGNCPRLPDENGLTAATLPDEKGLTVATKHDGNCVTGADENCLTKSGGTCAMAPDDTSLRLPRGTCVTVATAPDETYVTGATNLSDEPRTCLRDAAGSYSPDGLRNLPDGSRNLSASQMVAPAIQTVAPAPLSGSKNFSEGFAREFVENALLAYLRSHIGFLKEIHSLTYLQEIRKLCSVQST